MSTNTPANDPPRDSLAIEREAADWLARRDGEDWRDADQADFVRWLDADAAHHVAYLRLAAAWRQTGRLQALGAGWQGNGPPPRGYWQAPLATRSEQLLQAMAERPAARGPARKPVWVRAIATAAVLMACIGAGAWGWRAYHQVEITTYRTAMGQVEDLPLADGSQATLASNSQVEVRMSRRTRSVRLLQGEAIFAVAKDPGRPFVVDAGTHQAVAVGTRFSVRRDARDLRVVVTEGIVRLESSPGAGAPQPASLLPADSIALVREGGVLVRSVAPGDAQRLLDWREGVLAFRDTPLAEAAAEFNRYNPRKIVIGDADVGALRIGGSFRWDNAQGFAQLLEAGFPVRADYGAERIVLHSR